MSDPQFKGLWYLASPYSKYPPGIEFATADVARIAGALIGRGIAVYSPIAHTHPIAIASGLDPYDHDIWLPLDQHMMDAAVGVIIAKMDGWRESKGVTFEIAYFQATGKPVFLYDAATGDLVADPE